MYEIEFFGMKIDADTFFKSFLLAFSEKVERNSDKKSENDQQLLQM